MNTKSKGPKGIIVCDIGSTNTKSFLFDRGLNLIAERTMATAHRAGPPYALIDPEPEVAFLAATLREFDAILPVDKVVPCAHGSALALLDESGGLALPMMDYEALPPEDVIAGYAALEPEFAEVFAPTNPGALTLGRQLFWQETHHARAFARTTTIVPGGQYYAYRLCGHPATEVSALGAQTHLWDVTANRYSSLARARGWDHLFAPMRKAWQPLGTLNPAIKGNGFRGDGMVLTGIHDSNANFLRYLARGLDRFTLLSTGTWIIGFDTHADIARLDPRADMVSNTTVYGQPVASCRFMGGREFAIIADGAPAHAASLEALGRIIGQRSFALPSFTDTGGPLPGTGGKGRYHGPPVADAAERASLAALYCAFMTACSLRAIGAGGDIIVDGPFAENPIYLGCLAAAMPGLAVHASRVKNGTSAGAALLALADADGAIANRPVDLKRVPPVPIDGFAAYHADWQNLSRI